MAEGNDFFNTLIWPSVERLLQLVSGERVLDAACGTGVASRRLAQAGANVIAFDFSESMLSFAKKCGDQPNIDYLVVDATDIEALLALGPGTFDAVLCNMALFDISDVTPLMKAVASLLRPVGRFVFSTLHPCFNNPCSVQMGELEDRAGVLTTTYSVKISRYLTPYTKDGIGMPGQPMPHPYFHRPLGALLDLAFQAGLVLDALEERGFPPGNVGGSTPLSWSGNFSDIPPILVGRMRMKTIQQR
jgi:SAM-dependent methyltransferase